MREQLSAPAEWPVFAGIDWGGEHHQLCVVAPDGKRLLQLRVTHDVCGVAELDRHLHRFGDRLPIAVERSEGLLVEHLQAAGHSVFPVSPRISARARERYKVAAVKDDRFDAFVLADTLRHEHSHWRVLPVPSPLLAEIKALAGLITSGAYLTPAHEHSGPPPAGRSATVPARGRWSRYCCCTVTSTTPTCSQDSSRRWRWGRSIRMWSRSRPARPPGSAASSRRTCQPSTAAARSSACPNDGSPGGMQVVVE